MISASLFFKKSFLFLIGNLIPHHEEVFSKNPMFSGAKLPEVQKSQTLQMRFPKSSEDAKNFMEVIFYHFQHKQWYHNHSHLPNILMCNFYITFIKSMKENFFFYL